MFSLVGDGNNIYQFIYAKDIVNALKLALDHNKTDIFNIGFDDVKSFNEVYRYVVENANFKFRLIYFPKKLLTFCMKICYMLKISLLGLYQYKMNFTNFVFDTSKIKNVKF